MMPFQLTRKNARMLSILILLFGIGLALHVWLA